MLGRRSRPSKAPYPVVCNFASQQAVGLLGWWPGAGAGGSLWDKCGRLGNGNLLIGTIPTGGRWTTGVDGQKTAVSYDGSTNRTSLVDSARYFGTTRAAITIALWVKTSNIANYNYLLVNWGQAAGTDSFHLRLDITTGFPYFTHSATGNYVPANDLTGTVNCADGKWHHIVATRDSVAGVSKIYVDGKLNVSLTVAGNMIGLASSTVSMGGLSDGNIPSNWLLGSIDDPRLYNYAVPASLVLQMYDPRTRWDLRYRPVRKRILVNRTQFQPHLLTMENTFATRLRDKPRLNNPRLRPAMAETDPLALASLQLSTDRYVAGDFHRLFRDLFARPRGRFWIEPSQGATDPVGLTLEELSAERFVSGDFHRLMRDLAARPRGSFWNEPLQGATDPDGLTVANPEQEQSKFVSYEAATRVAPLLRWLNGQYWKEPIMGRIDPRALMLIESTDATLSQGDMQTVHPYAVLRAFDRRRLFSSTFGQIDPVSLMLAEFIGADKFLSPWRMRLLPRPPVTYTYGDALLETTLIPEDPPSLVMRSWYAPMWEPARPPVNRRDRHRFPVGTLDLDESQRPELIFVQSLEAPMRLPRWARAVRGHFYPAGDLGIDNADRAERIQVDEFRRLFDEPMRARVRILAAQAAIAQMLIDPAAASETITVDKFHRPFDVPRGQAQFWRGLMQIAQSEYDATTFSQPFIVKFIRSMLSAGF